MSRCMQTLNTVYDVDTNVVGMYTAINNSTAFGALSLYVEASGLCNHTVIGTAIVVWISCSTCCTGWTS